MDSKSSSSAPFPKPPINWHLISLPMGSTIPASNACSLLLHQCESNIILLQDKTGKKQKPNLQSLSYIIPPHGVISFPLHSLSYKVYVYSSRAVESLPHRMCYLNKTH